jgi:phosphoesterase RecJ-like protein
VNIDHHITNKHFARINHVDSNSSATGEIVFQLLKLMNLRLDAEVSTCLYTAITTDTGSFRYSNTTSETHRIAGELIDNGADVANISKEVFDTNSLEKIRLMGAAINALEFYGDGRIAFISINDAVFQKTGAKEEDFDGIVNIARNVSGVEAAAVFREKSPNEVKVSLRSNKYVDVRK